jgi:8-oxo-dGTP diphosphatase
VLQYLYVHKWSGAMQEATLVICLEGNPVTKVLLGYKKIGFGQGKYTGIGGKIKRGEGVVEAAQRELSEETGVHVPDSQSLEFQAILEFRFPRKRAWEHRVFVFVTQHWEGRAVESSEVVPQWFAIEDIPYDQMWDDARHWLPLALSGEKFQARFKFRADNQTVAAVKFSALRI